MNKILILIGIIISVLCFHTQLNAQCEAESGLPVAPLTTFSQCDDDLLALTIQEWEVEPSGTTDNALVVTHASFSDSLAVWDSPIVGVTQDGTFDFTDLESGTYCFHAFSYNQAELDTITNFETIQVLAPCLSGGEDLGTILSCIGSLGILPFASIRGAIENVLGTIIPGQVPAFSDNPPCFDPLPEGMEYCVEVTCTLTDVATNILDAINLKNVPNPFNNQTIIQFYSPFYQSFNFSVYNALGQTVYQSTFDADSGVNSFLFSASNLKPGIYVYELLNEAGLATNKMIIQ